MLEAKELTRSYGTRTAVRRVSFSVADGEVLGLLGPNGAGKSTAMKIVAGFLAADSGEATIDGVEVHADPLGARALVGWMPEVVPVYEDMEAGAYLDFCAHARGLSRSESRTRIAALSDELSITTALRRPIRELSRGYRQRCGLAQALLHAPRLLVLDEPTSGLDPTQIAGLHSYLRDLARSQRMSVVFSTHILPEVEAVADRIVVLNRGKVAFDGQRDALIQGEKAANFLDAFLACITRDNAAERAKEFAA
jgi:ABC-2 type transport system ATP-binding protein